jgi:hypothetical protein
MDVEVICVKRKPEYFCEKGWTGGSVICPSGLGKNSFYGNGGGIFLLFVGLIM